MDFVVAAKNADDVSNDASSCFGHRYESVYSVCIYHMPTRLCVRTLLKFPVRAPLFVVVSGRQEIQEVRLVLEMLRLRRFFLTAILNPVCHPILTIVSLKYFSHASFLHI